MLKIDGFLKKAGWNATDVSLKGLPATMGAKLSLGGGDSSRGLHRHTLGENEIFIITAGTARAIVNGEEFVLGRGEGQIDFLMTSDEEHGIFDKSPDFQCVIIFLKPEQKKTTKRKKKGSKQWFESLSSEEQDNQVRQGYRPKWMR